MSSENPDDTPGVELALLSFLVADKCLHLAFPIQASFHAGG